MECTGSALTLSYLNRKMICGCRQVVVEINARMKKINHIRRSNESWKTVHIMRTNNAGYNASAYSFRRVHVAIRALASLYAVYILCSSNLTQKYARQDSDRLDSDSASLGRWLRTFLRNVGYSLTSETVTHPTKPHS
jgi:hypothetical protein